MNMQDMNDNNMTIGIIENTVTIPREEYNELVYNQTAFDILRQVYVSKGKYIACDILEALFSECDETEEA